VLSADYFSIPEEEIKHLVSVLTMVGGKAVYAAEEFGEMAPPLPPILPEWSPVAAYGGYARGASGSVAARSKVTSAKIHDHAHCHEGGAGLACLCWAF
jgi:hypothetical protein